MVVGEVGMELELRDMVTEGQFDLKILDTALRGQSIAEKK